MKNLKHVVLVAPPGTSMLDIAGPAEVFAKTNDILEESYSEVNERYRIHVISTDGNTVVNTSTGIPIVAEGDLSSVIYKPDTILVSGIPGSPVNMVPDEVLEWLRESTGSVRRVGSICAGAIVLAEAGVLNGKRATTHWMVCEKLSKYYPQVKVDGDPIFIKDGNIYTSAGISAGMDLSLALVEEDFGRDIALAAARRLVLYLKRPGSQSQFSTVLSHQKSDYKPVSYVQEWILEHLEGDLSVEILADKAAMSPRNFARVFLRETGITPAKYIEKLRLETARRRLEETRLTIDEISSECGVGNGDSLRRLFLRHLKTTPGEYRRNFRSALGEQVSA